MENFLTLTALEPHQELKARGLLVRLNDSEAIQNGPVRQSKKHHMPPVAIPASTDIVPPLTPPPPLLPTGLFPLSPGELLSVVVVH